MAKRQPNSNPDDYEKEERAAIRQFDGGQDPEIAGVMAQLEIAGRNAADARKEYGF